MELGYFSSTSPSLPLLHSTHRLPFFHHSNNTLRIHIMDPPKDYHERMQRLGEEFAHMTHEFTASIQGLSETTQELAELMLSERGVSPRAPDPPIKKADDYHVKGKIKP